MFILPDWLAVARPHWMGVWNVMDMLRATDAWIADRTTAGVDWWASPEFGWIVLVFVAIPSVVVTCLRHVFSPENGVPLFVHKHIHEMAKCGGVLIDC